MTEIHVRQSGADGALATLADALVMARPGDVVIVHQGVYRENLRLPRGVTWRVAEGERAVIDGGWDGKTATNGQGNLVLFNEPDATMEGFTIRNAPGDGVAISGGGRRATLRGCTIHNCHESGLAANGTGTPLVGLTIEGNRVYDIARSWVVDKSRNRVAGCFLFRWVEDSDILNNEVSGGFGEIAAAGIQSKRLKFEGNVFHTGMHLGLYVNRATGCIIRNNLIYHTYDPEVAQADEQIPHGIVIGDERRRDDKEEGWQHSGQTIIEGNVVAWMGVLFSVRNNATDSGYDTRIDEGTVIRNNTFIGGPKTRRGIHIVENRHGHAAVGRFQGNVIHVAGDTIPLLCDAPGMRFGGNVWTARPEKLRAGDIVVPAAALVAANAEIVGDRYGSNIDIDHYRPTPGGALVGDDGRALAGALEPVTVEPPPPDPDPEPVDWAALLEKAAAVGDRLATMGAAGNLAREHLAAANEQLAVMSLAHEDAADDMAALLTMLDEYRLG